MTKKHFIALADVIRPAITGPVMVHETGKPVRTMRDNVIEALADFCASQNPRFNRERWLDYVAGKCGKNGGKVK